MFRTLVSSLRLMVLAAAMLFITRPLLANDYQKAWEALHQNDRKTARELLKKAMKDPATATDAAMTMVLLDYFDNQTSETADYWDKALERMTDPYPYYFTFWFNGSVAGDYGLKSKSQLKLLKNLLDDPKCSGSLKAAAQYQLGHYWITQGKFEDAQAAWLQCSNVGLWQFVGPFDNAAESGFDKDYEPIRNPKPDAVFKSAFQTDIQWFGPIDQPTGGWITPGFHVPYRTAIVYAQSFVTAPANQEVYLGAGFTGNIKIWVNDRLMISEPEQRRTDFDAYQVKCSLKKGANRILVQLGYEDEGYPNFAIRLTDAAGNLIPGLVSSNKYQPYTADQNKEQPKLVPFFAEAFFEQKIKKDPSNPLNYYLLSDTYLRNKKAQEALETVGIILEKAPNSSIFRYQRIQCYRKMENRTSQLQDAQFIKDNDPDALIALVALYAEAKDNEKWDEASDLLNRRIQLYGEEEDTWEEKIQLAARQQKVEDILRFIDQASAKYPESPYFARLRHDLAINMRKDPRAGMAIYEAFLEKNFSMNIAEALVRDYFEQGQNKKAVKMLETFASTYPDVPAYADRLFNYYYGQKENKKAQEQLDKLLRLAPYDSDNWENAARLAEQMGNTAGALQAFQKALHYNPNDFDSRRRIRELQKQPDLTSYFPQNDVYALIKNSKSDGFEGEHDFYYVLDEKATIIYPERTSETYHTLAIKLLNEKGIDRWKESSIGYNDNRQRLIIEKAEVVKANGVKIAAEQNQNQLVFPNLEVGDGIYIKYRLLSYTFGRISREYWDTYSFDGTMPVDHSRYVLLVHKNVPIANQLVNASYKPVVKNLEDFTMYTWESDHEEAVKDEKLMPSFADVGKTLHLSTLPTWSEVANWYADMSATQAKSEYYVQEVVQSLFPAGKTYSETEKARIIYEYVVKNIRYSSVPFRQGAYVPQRAAKVIQTKLGDCKDLSTLYAAIGRQMGLKVNLVLIDTRDNGELAMVLPSVEFNHCIVKVVADGKTWYLELTDEHLPFGCLPNHDLQALALEIPFGQQTTDAKLFHLDPPNRVRDVRAQVAEVNVEKRDLSIRSNGTRSGTPTVFLRDKYQSLSKQKRIEEMQNAIANDFTNPVTVKNVEFGNLEQLNDTLQYEVQYQVKNEVLEIGDLKSFKVPYYFVFLKADAFSEEKRTHPVSYWRYEDCDAYHEDLTIHLPAGKQFSEVPKDVSLSFNGTTYSIHFEKKSADTLRVVRDIRINRADVPTKDWPALREFVEAVVTAETKYVAFK